MLLNIKLSIKPNLYAKTYSNLLNKGKCCPKVKRIANVIKNKPEDNKIFRLIEMQLSKAA
jgi:hypothetical protein